MRQRGARAAVLAASRAASLLQAQSRHAPVAAAGCTLPHIADGQGMLFHSHARPEQSPSVATESGGQPNLIPFPREGPGVSYALNWALAAAGVTPAGNVTRNVNPGKLIDLSKGSSVKSASGSKVFVSGGQGDTALPPAQFKKVLREVTSHLSSLPSLFVQDGAVGSSSSSDARTRTICDSPGAASVLAGILTPTPTRIVTSDSFPITLYAVPSYKSSILGGEGFIAADFASSLIIAAGSAVGDTAALKSVLAAAAASPILARGAVSLPGRLVSGSGSSPFLLLAPSSNGDAVLSKSAAWPELGAIWGTSGVSRLFPLSSKGPGPNLYPSPSSLILLTSDSTGALPAATKLTPQQAAFYFLCGYDGTSFNLAFSRSPLSLGAATPLAVAQSLASLIGSTGMPTFLVNAHSEADVAKLVTSVAAGKVPSSKPASEDAVTALKTKLVEFAKGSVPSLPEDIAP